MALQAALQVATNLYGVELPEAYAKITSYQGDKERVVIFVDWWATGAARFANAQSLHQTRHILQPIPDENGWMEQLYEHLKTLPTFAGSIDV